MKYNRLSKLVMVVLTLVLLVGTPAAVYSVSDASGNSSQNNKLLGLSTYTSTAPGFYNAWSVPGINCQLQENTFGDELDLPAGANIFVYTWDVTKKTAPDAMNSLQAAADFAGAKLGPAVQVNFTVRSKLGFKQLTGGMTQITIGIPESFRREGARYAVARVTAGGEVSYFENDAIAFDPQNGDPKMKGKAIAITVPSGYAAYALIRYDN